MILTPMTISPCYCWGKERALELRHFCCINFHLFYKWKTVTNPDVILYMLTTDFSLLVCKHPGKLRCLFNQNLLLLHCLHVMIPAVQQSCPLYVFSGRNPQLQKFQMQGRKVSQHMHYDRPSKYCSYRSLSCLDHLIILNPFTAISKNPYSFHLIFEEYMDLKFTGRHRITETFLWYHQRSSRPSSHSNGDYYQHYSRTALVLIHHSLEIWKYEDSSLSEQIVPILLHSS